MPQEDQSRKGRLIMLRPSITNGLARQRNSENFWWYTRCCHDSAVPYGTGPRTLRYPALRAGLLSGRPCGTSRYKQLSQLGGWIGMHIVPNSCGCDPAIIQPSRCAPACRGKSLENVETPAARLKSCPDTKHQSCDSGKLAHSADPMPFRQGHHFCCNVYDCAAVPLQSYCCNGMRTADDASGTSRH